MRYIIIILYAASTALPCFGQRDSVQVLDKNTQVSIENKEFPHAEPHLIVNPINKNQLVSASMMYTKSNAADRIVTYYSNDSGKTAEERLGLD